EVTRARVTYAFRVFAAIYNYRVVEDGASQETRIVLYGGPASPSDGPNSLRVPARYAPDDRIARLPASPKCALRGKTFIYFTGSTLRQGGQTGWERSSNGSRRVTRGISPYAIPWDEFRTQN